MSSLVKAVVISAIVFIVIIIGAVFFLSSQKQRGPRIAERDRVTEPDSKSSVAEPRGVPIDTARIVREGVKITFQVMEIGRKRELPGSRVMILKATDGNLFGEKVDEKTGDGNFELLLEPGAYVARVSCPRFTGQKRNFTVLKDSPQKLVFELERGNSISGHVYAKGGQPISGARVLALRELAMPGAGLEEILMAMVDIQSLTGKTAFAAEDISAADGSYTLDGLVVHAFTVRATAPGFVPGEIMEVPSPRVGVDIYLEKGGLVGGFVRDTAGNPVDGATVSAYVEVESQDVFRIIQSKARPPLDSVETDSSGRFQFKTLGPDVYNFLVEAKGYQRGEFLKNRIAPGQATELAFTVNPGLVLRGIVTGPSGEPVPGAKIRPTLMSPGAAARKDQVNLSFDEDKVVTNEQGEFMTDTLEEGTYMLLCWHQDYQTLRKSDIRVGVSNDELKLKLSHGGRVHGVVTDASSGKPIAGARISANDVADLHKDAVTQEDGTFVLSGLGGAGGNRSVTFNVTATGFARARRDVKVEDDREVAENFELQPTGLVTGRVVNSNGEPISGARVMAKRASDSASSVEQILSNDLSDRDGKFQLSGIEAGENTVVRVKKAEFLDGASAAFAVEPSGALALDPILMQLGGSLGGTVLGADGKPIAGAMVIVTSEGETELQQAGNPSSPTSSRGEFLIQGLKSGTVDLVVKAVHHLEKRLVAIEIQEGRLHGDIKVQLEMGNTVSGVVLDSKGKPIVSAEIVGKDFAQGMKEIRTSSGNDGTFTVEGILAADVVELSVSHESFTAYNDPKVRVGSTDLKIVLQELGSLRGIVVDSKGVPIATAFTVQAQNPTAKDPRKQPKTQTYTSADGSFEYKGVPAGTYTVFVRSPQYSAWSRKNVQLSDGEVVDLGAIELEEGGRVFGKVIDAASKQPIEGARVQIAQGSSRFMKSTGTQTGGPAPNPVQVSLGDGSFAFNGLKGGTLSLRTTHDGYLSHKIDDVNPDLADKSQDLVIELEQGGEITGIVYDNQGKPRSGINVYLIGEDSSSNQTQPTDKTGRYRFQAVQAGSFTVKAHKFGSAGSGAEQAERSVVITSGSIESADLQLE